MDLSLRFSLFEFVDVELLSLLSLFGLLWLCRLPSLSVGD